MTFGINSVDTAGAGAVRKEIGALIGMALLDDRNRH